MAKSQRGRQTEKATSHPKEVEATNTKRFSQILPPNFPGTRPAP